MRVGFNADDMMLDVGRGGGGGSWGDGDGDMGRLGWMAVIVEMMEWKRFYGVV